jgi:hypothetical protein
VKKEIEVESRRWLIVDAIDIAPSRFSAESFEFMEMP